MAAVCCRSRLRRIGLDRRRPSCRIGEIFLHGKISIESHTVGKTAGHHYHSGGAQHSHQLLLCHQRRYQLEEHIDADGTTSIERCLKVARLPEDMDRQRQQSRIQQAPPVDKPFDAHEDVGEGHQRHDLGIVPDHDIDDDPCAEDRRQCNKERCRARGLLAPHQQEHSHSINEVVHHNPHDRIVDDAEDMLAGVEELHRQIPPPVAGDQIGGVAGKTAEDVGDPEGCLTLVVHHRQIGTEALPGKEVVRHKKLSSEDHTAEEDQQREEDHTDEDRSMVFRFDAGERGACRPDRLCRLLSCSGSSTLWSSAAGSRHKLGWSL